MRRPWSEVVVGVAGVVLGVAASAGAATSAGPEGTWETLDEAESPGPGEKPQGRRP